MYRPVLKSLVLATFAIAVASPSFAQVRVDLGPVHIRIANDAPPRARYERRTPRPDPDSVWINGYWDRQGDRWAWSSGRWERPHDRHSRWIKPTYQREGKAWRYEPARWSDQQLVEGEDYQQWRKENRSDRDRHPN